MMEEMNTSSALNYNQDELTTQLSAANLLSHMMTTGASNESIGHELSNLIADLNSTASSESLIDSNESNIVPSTTRGLSVEEGNEFSSPAPGSGSTGNQSIANINEVSSGTEGPGGISLGISEEDSMVNTTTLTSISIFGEENEVTQMMSSPVVSEIPGAYRYRYEIGIKNGTIEREELSDGYGSIRGLYRFIINNNETIVNYVAGPRGLTVLNSTIT